MNVKDAVLSLLAVVLIAFVIRSVVRDKRITGKALTALGLALGLIGAVTLDLSNISQFFQLQLTIGQVFIGLGILVVVVALIFFVTRRYRSKRRSGSITSGKEYFEAIWDSVLWEIDKLPDEEASEEKIVTGPLCKACKMLMESKWSYSDGRAMRSRMPDVNTEFICTSCGNTVKPPAGLVNIYQIKSRVYEFYRAEMRKKEMATAKPSIE